MFGRLTRVRRQESNEWKKDIENHIPFSDTVAGRGSTKIETGLVESTKKDILKNGQPSPLFNANKSFFPANENNDLIPEKIVSTSNNSQNQNGNNAESVDAVAPDFIPFSSPKINPDVTIFRISCPGSKVPIRATPSVKGAIKKYVYSGDELEVFRSPVSGFYKLTQDQVFKLILYSIYIPFILLFLS
jgi:hypothetical protein